MYLWAKNWEKIEILKPNMTPVPIMEIIKSGKDCTDTISENSHRIEIKTETKFSLKDDHDEKSIASDSELMKILEEDNITSDESKNIGKKEDLVHQNKSHILLDALTKNDTIEIKYKNSISSDIKTNTGKNRNKSLFITEK